MDESIVCCSCVRAVAHIIDLFLSLDGTQIRPHHPSPSLRRTLATVLRIVHTELGFATTTDDNDDDDDTTLRTTTTTTTTYLLLAIPSRRIVGVVQTEPLQQAYRLHSSSSSRSRTPVPATLGVHLVWIHRTVRRQGYASLLIEHIIRSSSCSSTTITARPRLAWSSPTPAGVALARHVAAAAKDNNNGRRGGGEADHHHPVLVYDVVEGTGSTQQQKKNNDNRPKRPPRSSSSTD